MGCWVSDGSSGFIIDGNSVSQRQQPHVCDLQCIGTHIFNCMWQEGDGVSSGKHYWKIKFETLAGSAGVGLTSKDHFNWGYACRSIKYNGSLENGFEHLQNIDGPSISSGDVVGILAVFEDDRLKMFIDINGKSLGLTFDVPASTFDSVFPFLSFDKSGSATCIKQIEIPKNTDRVRTTFTGIEGDWKLIDFKKDVDDIATRPPLKFVQRITCKIRQEGLQKYTWITSVGNSLEATLFLAVDGNWKTYNFCQTLKGLLNVEWRNFEDSVGNLMRNGVKTVGIKSNGNLCIMSESIISQWTRYDAPLPVSFIGDPFQVPSYRSEIKHLEKQNLVRRLNVRCGCSGFHSN